VAESAAAHEGDGRGLDLALVAAALHVFGAEDATLGRNVLSWCRDVVAIPGGCLNLAAAVNVVLYDRIAKLLRDGSLDEVPGAAVRRAKLEIVG